MRLNISLRRWTHEDGPLHRPVGTAVVHATYGSKAHDVNRGSASFQTSASTSSTGALAFCRRHQAGTERLSCGYSYSEHPRPPSSQCAAPTTTFITCIPTLPQAGEGFLRTNMYCQDSCDSSLSLEGWKQSRRCSYRVWQKPSPMGYLSAKSFGDQLIFCVDLGCRYRKAIHNSLNKLDTRALVRI